jgi:hypothetical protein
MKAIVLGASLFIAASSASAGGYDAPVVEPVVEPVVIVEDAADSSANSAGLVLGITTLLLFGAAAVN